MPITFASTHKNKATSGTSITITSVTGGTNQFYALFIAVRNNVGVSSVSGGGLTWTLRKAQCSGRSQQGINCYTAYGTPSPSPFTITINFSSSIAATVCIVARYTDAAGTVSDSQGANTNGPNGACSGGTDNGTYTITITPTKANSMLVVGTNPRNDPIDVFDVDYTTRDTDNVGAGGDLTYLYVQDFLKPTAVADVCTNQTTFDTNDWAMAAVALDPPVVTLTPGSLSLLGVGR